MALTQREIDYLKLTFGDDGVFTTVKDALDKIDTISSVSTTELLYLDLTAIGTVQASKAVVVDANKDASAFRNLGAVNVDAGSSGAAGTVDIFPSTASKGKIALTAADSAGDTTTTIVNASQAGARTYTIPDAGAAASFVMTKGATEYTGARTFLDDINAGKSGDAATVNIFPATASKGSVKLSAADSAGDTVTTIVNASQAGARTYTIPDAGGAANFCLLTSAQASAGKIGRADLTQDDLAKYMIPLYSLRAADGNVLGISDTEDSGDHYLSLAANVWKLFGNSPNSDTQTDVSYFCFQLPPEYVGGETVTLRINALYTSDGDTKTLDAEVYEAADAGTIGSDLVATAAQTLTGSAANYDFTVTPTGLVAGDMLNVKITTVFADLDGIIGEAQINSIQFLVDIKG